MLIQFSGSILQQIMGVFFFNRYNLIFYVILNSLVAFIYIELDQTDLALHVVPTSILGGALAIFLGFRNNSAYDRWWEGRKIWGGIVNYSRTFSIMLHSMLEDQALIKRGIHKHLAWMYSVNFQLRKKDDFSQANDYLSQEDLLVIDGKANRATQILKLQALNLKELKSKGMIDSFEYVKLLEIQEELFNLQGKAERIKGTVFPYYYTYFTGFFLWVFVLLLPFSLVSDLGWMSVPICTAISFVFGILHKTGNITEDPFENRAADVPLDAICRTIEIDLIEHLGEAHQLEKTPIQRTRFNTEFIT